MKRNKKKVIYEVFLEKKERWVKCWRAKEQLKGFLHYELADGTLGFARPGSWHKIEHGKKNGSN